MNKVQETFNAIAAYFSNRSEPTLPEVIRVPRQKLSMNERIVYLDTQCPIDISLCKSSLNEMFQKRWFDLLVVDRCMDLLKVSRTETGKSFDRLRLLHCVDWAKMTEEVRDLIPVLISDLFTEGSYSAHVSSIVSEQ